MYAITTLCTGQQALYDGFLLFSYLSKEENGAVVSTSGGRATPITGSVNRLSVFSKLGAIGLCKRDRGARHQWVSTHEDHGHPQGKAWKCRGLGWEWSMWGKGSCCSRQASGSRDKDNDRGSEVVGQRNQSGHSLGTEEAMGPSRFGGSWVRVGDTSRRGSSRTQGGVPWGCSQHIATCRAVTVRRRQGGDSGCSGPSGSGLTRSWDLLAGQARSTLWLKGWT